MLENATIAELERACADNHRELFRYNAKAVGGELNEADRVYYYYTPKNGSNIVFPVLTPGNVRAKLDEVVNYYRLKGAWHIGFWSLDPSMPPDLDVYLLARGFQNGWQPRWMAMDFARTRVTSVSIEGITIGPDRDVDVSKVADLPYCDDSGAVSGALFKAYPAKVQRIVARQNGAVIGHCCIFFGSGDYGVAGIYNVGVIPSMRNKGVALAIMQEASKYIASNGYAYAILNANDAGRGVYGKAGYKTIGYGKTWWINNNKFITNPASPELTELAEFVGSGDIPALEKIFADDASSSLPATPGDPLGNMPDNTLDNKLGNKLGNTLNNNLSNPPGDKLSNNLGILLNTLLPNDFSLVQIAAQLNRPAVAEWLVDHGAVYSALDAWDLGWHDRAESLLKLQPREIDRRYYDWQGNLLHVAAERNDESLAKLALAHHVNRALADKHHGGTPLDWAIFFKRTDIIRLIRSYEEA